jgi:hypothetical protein
MLANHRCGTWLKTTPAERFEHCQTMRQILPNNVPRNRQNKWPIHTIFFWGGKTEYYIT